MPRMRSTAGLHVVSLLAGGALIGCALEPVPALGQPCETTTDCPRAYRCHERGFCVPDDALDAGTLADGGTPDGGVPPASASVLPDYLVVVLGDTASTTLRTEGAPAGLTVDAELGLATIDGTTISYTAPAAAGRDTIAVTWAEGATGLVVDVVDPASFDQVWTGGGEQPFADPSNWQGGAPYGSVLVPAGTPAPIVDADLTVEQLVIATGVLVDAEDVTLTATVAAGVGGAFTERSLVVAAGAVAGHFDDLTVGTDATLAAPTLIADDVVITGATNQALDVAGERLEVLGDLSTIDRGRLRMADPDARVIVRGNATFQGGATNDGSLVAGQLEVHGNFAQAYNSSVGAETFAAAGAHRTLFVGATQQSATISNPSSSTFANVEVAGAGTVLATAAIAAGDLLVRAGSSLAARSGQLEVRGETIVEMGAAIDADRLLVRSPTAFADPSTFVVDLLIVDDGVEALQPELRYLDLEVRGPVEAAGAMAVGGALLLTSDNGELRVRDASITVSGALDTDDRGVLRMDDGQGRVEVLGLATFAGGNGGALSAGTLVLRGGLAQRYNSSVGDNTLVATNLHETRFVGGPQSVSFENPGPSHLRHVVIEADATVTCQTDITIDGNLTIDGALFIEGAHTVTVVGATEVNGTLSGTLCANGGCSGIGCPPPC